MRKMFSAVVPIFLVAALSGCQVGWFGRDVASPWWTGASQTSQPSQVAYAPVATQRPVDTAPPAQARLAAEPPRTVIEERLPLPATQAALAQAAADSGIKRGEGSPFYLIRGVRSRADLARAIRVNDRSVLRAKPEDFHRQIAGLGIPVPASVAEFADWLELDSNIVEVSCTPALLREYWMGRTNRDATVFDLNWTRLECGKGEVFLAYRRNDGKVQAFLSLWCGNVLTPRPPQRASVQAPPPSRPPAPRVPQAAAAPSPPRPPQPCDRQLALAVYDWNSFPDDLKARVTEIHSVEPRGKEAVSLTLGLELWNLHQAGTIRMAPGRYVFFLRLARNEGSAMESTLETFPEVVVENKNGLTATTLRYCPDAMKPDNYLVASLRTSDHPLLYPRGKDLMTKPGQMHGLLERGERYHHMAFIAK